MNGCEYCLNIPSPSDLERRYRARSRDMQNGRALQIDHFANSATYCCRANFNYDHLYAIKEVFQFDYVTLVGQMLTRETVVPITDVTKLPDVFYLSDSNETKVRFIDREQCIVKTADMRTVIPLVILPDLQMIQIDLGNGNAVTRKPSTRTVASLRTLCLLKINKKHIEYDPRAIPEQSLVPLLWKADYPIDSDALIAKERLYARKKQEFLIKRQKITE